MSIISIFILDDSNITKSELKMIKSKTYEEFLNQIRLKCNIIIPENYEMFILDDKNNQIKINNEINYNKIKDILFIREINKNALQQSIYDINYNTLSESKQNILDEKYNCLICSVLIKKENPYLCYKCQKIFHIRCLKDWDNKCKQQNKKLICPNCRNELPIEKWYKKIDHEENRKEHANLINLIRELKSNNNNDNKIDFQKDKKINELNLLNKKYEEYINNALKVFNNILNKMNLIHSLFNLEKNIQLNNLLVINPFNSNNINNININSISNVINEEFDQFINHINKDKKIQNNLSNQISQKEIDKEKNILENSDNKNLIDNQYKEDVQPEPEPEKNKEQISEEIEQLNINIQNQEEKKNKEFNIETLFQTPDGRIIFRNGILKGIVNKYYEINDVVSKIQDILAKGAKFNLVYKASELGDEAETFHLMCDNLNMSLVLIETYNNTRFGGFTTKSWSGKNIKKYDSYSFVFNLQNNTIFDIIPNEPAIGCYPKFGPVFFGCQIRIYDKFFINGGTTCHAGLNYKTTIDYELNNGNQIFIVKDIEVYSIEAVDI